MKKTSIVLAALVCLVALVSAHPLETYPELLKTDNHMDAIIVVGDKASATHVLAQTQIALSLANEMGAPIPGLTRLASDVEGSIGNINVISVGNACDNPLSAEILGNPSPCDAGLDKSKARVEVYGSQSGKHHIVLNAYGDAGVKKLAAVLANYKDYPLDGNLFEIEVDGEKERIFEAAPSKPQPQEKPEEEEKQASEEEEEAQEKDIQQAQPVKENETSVEQYVGAQTQPEPILKKEDNFILKMINWFKNLFQ